MTSTAGDCWGCCGKFYLGGGGSGFLLAKYLAKFAGGGQPKLNWGQPERFVEKRGIKFLDLRFDVPDVPSFLWQCREIFEEEIYRFEAQSERPIILDCGANVGVSAIYFKRLCPNAHIIAFEADASIAAYLRKNLAQNGILGVEVWEKAVWIHDRGIIFEGDGADGGRVRGEDCEGGFCGENAVNLGESGVNFWGESGGKNHHESCPANAKNHAKSSAPNAAEIRESSLQNPAERGESCGKNAPKNAPNPCESSQENSALPAESSSPRTANSSESCTPNTAKTDESSAPNAAGGRESCLQNLAGCAESSGSNAAQNARNYAAKNAPRAATQGCTAQDAANAPRHNVLQDCAAPQNTPSDHSTPQNAPHPAAKTHAKRVESVRLRDVLEGFPRIDFLKIDIEGAECAVLPDCRGALSRVRNIFVEYHSRENLPQNLGEILTILADCGFRVQLETITKPKTPFLAREIPSGGFDLQINIFGFRRG